MEYRQLGTTGIGVSVIGVGCWAMGGRSWGPVDDRESVAAIHRALDLGVNLFDTAPVYGFGHSETLLGRTLGSARRDVIIATKVGLVWDDAAKISNNLLPDHIRSEVEGSLRRLATDYIDLYQIHWPDPKVPIEASVRVLEALKAEGKVRAIGCSNFDVPLLEASRAGGRLESLQPHYSLLERDTERELLPYCEREKLGVLVYGPLAKGLLTGKFRRDSSFPPDDMRLRDKRFQGEAWPENLARVERLRSLAHDLGLTPAQLALAWVLRTPVVTAALCGTKRPSQIEENASAAGVKLGADEIAALSEIFPPA